MLKTERVSVMNFENALRGMRNPMNSWDKSDSGYDENGQGEGENDGDEEYKGDNLSDRNPTPFENGTPAIGKVMDKDVFEMTCKLIDNLISKGDRQGAEKFYSNLERSMSSAQRAEVMKIING